MKKIALLTIPMISLHFASHAQTKMNATPVYDNIHREQGVKEAKNPTFSTAQNNDQIPSYTPQKLSNNAGHINLTGRTTTQTNYIKKATFKKTNYRSI